MSGLLEALHRLESGVPPTAPSLPCPAPERSASFVRAPQAEPHDSATAIVAACPPPALIAVIGIGVDEPLAPLLRETAEAVAGRIGRDVVLLGPGLLDDVATLTTQWSALRGRAAYGFVLAPAEYAVGRLDGLRRVDAVVPVVELGRTSSRAVEAVRRLLMDRGIVVLGPLVVGE